MSRTQVTIHTPVAAPYRSILGVLHHRMATATTYEEQIAWCAIMTFAIQYAYTMSVSNATDVEIPSIRLIRLGDTYSFETAILTEVTHAN